MPKGIIVIEQIPSNCYECGNHNYHSCSWTGECIKEYYDDNGRPDACPIKELPERMKYHDGTYNGQVKGWNLCLEEILRKSNI